MTEPFRKFFERELACYRVSMPLEYAGSKAAAAGLALEQEIQYTNRRYEAMGYGSVTKNYVMTRFARGSLRRVAKQTVDFTGFLADIGFVGFDAKTTEKDVYRIDRNQVHQLCYLLTGQRAMKGQHARFFYLIEHRNGHSREKYLVEDLEALADTGVYRYRPEDLLPQSTIGAPADYRAKLIASKLFD